MIYTDGLVERRGESIDTGIERLLDALSEHPEADPETLVDALREPGGGADDVCVLVFRRAG